MIVRRLQDCAPIWLRRTHSDRRQKREGCDRNSVNPAFFFVAFRQPANPVIQARLAVCLWQG